MVHSLPSIFKVQSPITIPWLQPWNAFPLKFLQSQTAQSYGCWLTFSTCRAFHKNVFSKSVIYPLGAQLVPLLERSSRTFPMRYSLAGEVCHKTRGKGGLFVAWPHFRFVLLVIAQLPAPAVLAISCCHASPNHRTMR